MDAKFFFNKLVLQAGLPDAFCKNAGHVGNRDRFGCIRKRIFNSIAWDSRITFF